MLAGRQRFDIARLFTSPTMSGRCGRRVAADVGPVGVLLGLFTADLHDRRYDALVHTS